VLRTAQYNTDLIILGQAQETGEKTMKATSDEADLLHQRLGHVGIDHLTASIPLITGVPDLLLKHSTLCVCEPCIQAKQHIETINREAFTPSTIASFEKIHSDIWGPSSIQFKAGKRYFVTFVNDYTHWDEPVFIREKSEIFQEFKKFKARVELQHNAKIKRIHSNSGSEYLSTQFTLFCKSCGIKQEPIAPYTPSQNGVAERRNRTYLEIA
jgi:hypothetical protein